MPTTLEINPIAGSKLSGTIELPETCRVLTDGEKPLENEILFSILTQKDGDKRIVWDTNKLPEIHDAKELFNKLIAEGFVPYRIKSDGSQEIMHTFDPAAGQVLMKEIVFVPQKMVVGG